MRNILIPMAGRGQRFVDAGYKLPKPLIDVAGKPLIQRVVESLDLPGQYIYIVQQEHLDSKEYDLCCLLNRITPKCIIIPVKEVTQGAVCSCLLAYNYINNESPLIIANSDQILRFSRADFLMKTTYTDGCLLTFEANDPKWSYVKTSKEQVLEVAEKKVVSNQANCGLYAWAEGKDFVWSANRLIADDIRTNNEFYIAETYNILINKGYYITAHKAIEMLPAGTPTDLENTIKIIKGRE